jgi:1-acyl-sn-glycerol-3-phosphate acyltransferase
MADVLPVPGDGMWRDSTGVRWVRRTLSITGLTLVTIVYAALLPVLLVSSALKDTLQGKPWVGVRFHLLVMFALLWHYAGLIPLLYLWIAAGRWLGKTPSWWHERNRRLETWWVSRAIGSVERLYDMRIEIEGLDQIPPGPVLLLSRHASIIDTILPIRVLSNALGVTLRIVKKRELLWDPCVDIISHRLPRTFVRRGSGNSERELEQVEKLLGGLDEDDVVCIFPEGTRFTPEKRKRIVGKLRREHPQLAARAERLRHLLPPKPGGTLALYNRRPDMDVVFCAHTGLEGAGRIQDFAKGALLKKTVKIRFWRVSAADVPKDFDAQTDWLFFWWDKLDRWIDKNKNGQRAAATSEQRSGDSGAFPIFSR